MPNDESARVEDHQGGGGTSLWSESMPLALDDRTSIVRWRPHEPRTGGVNVILATAGGLVFTNDRDTLSRWMRPRGQCCGAGTREAT